MKKGDADWQIMDNLAEWATTWADRLVAVTRNGDDSPA